MLPLLVYKIHYCKKDMIKTDNKVKKSSIGKFPLKLKYNQTGNNNRLKIKKPSMMEVTILLFGMFGVPIFYFCYWNLMNLYQWSMVKDEYREVKLDTTPFKFEPVSISIDHIIESRLSNMKKYPYNHSWTDIDRRSNLSMEEFRDVYSGKWPVIITDCGTKWPAFTKWNSQFFTSNFGKNIVTIKTMADDVSETFVMPFEIYLKHLHEAYPHQWTYLSDELFIPSRPALQRDLGTCKETKEDFFELFPVELRPWWSLLLWGTRFSRSELHMDPFNWTGTNFVISGLKQWKLFPPGQDHLLHIIGQQKFKFPINSYKYNSEIDCFKENAVHTYPSLRKAKAIEFYQYPGELLIIPTGWFHQAYNEEATLAVAGQMMNSDNYLYVLEEIFKGGDLSREGYESKMRLLSPREQVNIVLKTITEEVRREGREATQFIYDQLKKAAVSSGLPIPPSITDLNSLSAQGQEKK